MENGIIVCGLGHVGFRIVELFNRLGETTTVIYEETSAEWVSQAEQQGNICIHGNAASERLLTEAGIKTARAIIAATDSDTTNLSIIMDAERLNPGIISVIRLFDQELAQPVEAALNVRRVLSTSSLAAPMFVASALGQNVCALFSADNKAYVVRELPVLAGSGWLGLTPEAWAAATGMTPLYILSNARMSAASSGTGPIKEGDTILASQSAAGDSDLHGNTRKHEAQPSFARRNCRRVRNIWNQTSISVKGIILSLFSLVLIGTLTFHYYLKLNGIDALYFVITTITTTGYGDFNLASASTAMKLFGCLLMLSGAALIAAVFSVITELILKARFREFFNMPVFPQNNHLIVVGMQNHGLKVIQELRNAKKEVIAIDHQPGESRGGSTLKGIPVITGDPRLEELLMKARVHKASAIIASSDNDILNLSTTLSAKKINPSIRTVIRTFDADLGSKLHSHLGIDGVISASAVSAPMFVGVTIARDVVQGIIWKNHLIVIQRGDTPPSLMNDNGVMPIYSPMNGMRLSASAYALKSK